MSKISDYFKDTEFVHCYRATKYCEDVVSGKISAGLYNRLACQRQLDDLCSDFEFNFDPVKAERICKFAESMPHTKGPWAKRKELMVLQPWQSFILTTIFGWIGDDGFRRFSYFYGEIPRKNGKSIMAAIIQLYMLTMDDEEGAEIFSGATNEKQAWMVFGPAKKMVEANHKFRDEFGIEVNAKSLVVPSTNSVYIPEIGKPGDGPSPSCYSHDEYHEHQTNAQRSSAKTGMGSRDQPLQIIITTAGDDEFGPCYDARIEATKILNKTIVNNRAFVIIYHIDKDDDWACPLSLIKANPNYDISAKAKYFIGEQQDAINSPDLQSGFRTKNLNQWVGAKLAYFDMQKWAKCADDKMDINDYYHMCSYVAGDLSSHIDFTCLMHLFTKMIDGLRHYYIFPQFYLPVSAIKKDKTGNYQIWKDEGLVNFCDGEEIDFQKVEDDIADAWNEHQDIQDVSYDPHKAQQLSQRLRDLEGVVMVEYKQVILTMSQPMKELQGAINSGRLHHSNHKVMNWMIGNVIAKEDRKDNVYPNKERRENKIDGPVSLIMAIGRATINDDNKINDISQIIDFK